MTDVLVTALVPVKQYHPAYLREATGSLLAAGAVAMLRVEPRQRAAVK